MMLIHTTINVTGDARDLLACAVRVRVLAAEFGITGALTEQHAPHALHYDLKAAGGIPFPPFAIASGEFPNLEILVEWIDPAQGVRGMARIARGALTEQKIENIAAADAGYAVAIRVGGSGYLELALAAIRSGRDECRGYMLTGKADALFRIVRDPDSGHIDLYTTEGAAEWSRAWHLSAAGSAEYRRIEPVQPIAAGDFSELEKLAQEFVAQWVWFGSGPREETAIEAERYARLGYTVSDANLRSAALHRIQGDAGSGGDGIRYSTLAAEIAWVEAAIARCWPGEVNDKL